MPDALSAAALRVSMECGGLLEHTQSTRVMFPAAGTTVTGSFVRFIPSMFFEHYTTFIVQLKANCSFQGPLTWERTQL